MRITSLTSWPVKSMAGEEVGALRLDERGVTPAFLSHVARVTARAHTRALAEDPSADALVFLPDPMNPHSHEADFRALIRVPRLAYIPFALSPTSADHLARGMPVAEGGTAAARRGGA